MVAILLAVLLSAPSAAAPSAPVRVVHEFYAIIIREHPIGLPAPEVKSKMAPFLSARLSASLRDLEACERDYFKRYRAILERRQLKPGIGWLEYGLFSGADERALPAEVVVTSVRTLGDGRLRAEAEFTYRETFATYGRRPDPKAAFKWRGAVMLVHRDDQYLIDDFIPIDDETGRDRPPLVREFKGCRAGRWVGTRPY